MIKAQVIEEPKEEIAKELGFESFYQLATSNNGFSINNEFADMLAERAIKRSKFKIDIDFKDYYMYDKPELKERTRARLIEIAECGMEEVGYGQFGYRGIMSGLYIEIVWSHSDEAFKGYMDWARGLIKEKTTS